MATARVIEPKVFVYDLLVRKSVQSLSLNARPPLFPPARYLTRNPGDRSQMAEVCRDVAEFMGSQQ